MDNENNGEIPNESNDNPPLDGSSSQSYVKSDLENLDFNELFPLLKNKLLGAFSELTSAQKEVLKLFLEGYDNEEISQVIDKKKGNVAALKEIAIKNLRKKIAPLKLKGNNKTVANILRDFYNDSL